MLNKLSYKPRHIRRLGVIYLFLGRKVKDMSRSLAPLFAALLAAACFATNAGSASAHTLPVVYNGVLGYAQTHPTASPPGANDWSCQPSAAHPRPVVLVHGTFADRSNSWQAISPLLHNRGYCVFALNYGAHNGSGAIGVYGVGDISDSAAELDSFVDQVLAATGAAEVDLVGHSQGGMMPRYYLKNLGGAAEVNTLVGLSSSNHGTTLHGLFTLGSYFPGSNSLFGTCPACEQQEAGSPFLTQLNAGGETVPGVSYTVIQTRYDQVVTPYTSAFLSGPGVSNILLQSQCVLDLGDHLSMPYDHIAAADMLTALDPSAPAKPACTPVVPLAGG
jgi:triacylglycerol esterase/lipase EstA (alpha/beta hydrolase family)